MNKFSTGLFSIPMSSDPQVEEDHVVNFFGSDAPIEISSETYEYSNEKKKDFSQEGFRGMNMSEKIADKLNKLSNQLKSIGELQESKLSAKLAQQFADEDAALVSKYKGGQAELAKQEYEAYGAYKKAYEALKQRCSTQIKELSGKSQYQQSVDGYTRAVKILDSPQFLPYSAVFTPKVIKSVLENLLQIRPPAQQPSGGLNGNPYGSMGIPVPQNMSSINSQLIDGFVSAAIAYNEIRVEVARRDNLESASNQPIEGGKNSEVAQPTDSTQEQITDPLASHKHSEDSGYGKQVAQPGEQTPQQTDPKWDAYVKATAGGEKVRNAWVGSTPSGYTADFDSFVKWYKDQIAVTGKSDINVDEAVILIGGGTLPDSPIATDSGPGSGQGAKKVDEPAQSPTEQNAGPADEQAATEVAPVTIDEVTAAVTSLTNGTGDIMRPFIDQGKVIEAKALSARIATRRVSKRVKDLGGPEAAATAMSEQFQDRLNSELGKLKEFYTSTGNGGYFDQNRQAFIAGIAYNVLAETWASQANGKKEDHRQGRINRQNERELARARRRAKRKIRKSSAE